MMQAYGRRARAVEKGITVAFATALVLLPIAAQAQNSLPVTEALQFNGYATLGVVHSSERRADYLPNPLRVDGAGRSDNPSLATDSLAALQASYRFSSSLVATAQVVVEQDYLKGVRPRLEWGNLQYQLTEALDFRLGRIALNTFMVSDFRKVGYATPWVRPPAELYQLVAITNSDGLDLTYRVHHEGTQYSSQLVYGRNRLSQTEGELSVPNLWGSFNRLERGPLTLHAGYLAAKLEIGLTDELWAGYRAFGAAGESVVARYDASGERATFLSLGAAWDAGDWFAQAEWGRGDTRSEFGQRTGWYISAGQRYGDWTPYLTYARALGSNRDVQGLDSGQFAAPLRPAIDELNNSLFLLQSGTAPHQVSISVGLRLDWHPNASATVQYDRINTRKGSIGLFRNLERPDYRPGGAGVFSLAIDFLF